MFAIYGGALVLLRHDSRHEGWCSLAIALALLAGVLPTFKAKATNKAEDYHISA